MQKRGAHIHLVYYVPPLRSIDQLGSDCVEICQRREIVLNIDLEISSDSKTRRVTNDFSIIVIPAMKDEPDRKGLCTFWEICNFRCTFFLQYFQFRMNHFLPTSKLFLCNCFRRRGWVEYSNFRYSESPCRARMSRRFRRIVGW